MARFCYDFPRPAVAVDLVVFTVLDADLKVLLIRRREPPFAGSLALPGGFLRVGEGDEPGETLEQAARRELEEETGLRSELIFLRQLGAYSEVDRDPRGRVISIAYFALVSADLAPLVRAGGDAAGAQWWSLEEVRRERLAFDHERILRDGLDRLRSQLLSSPIAFHLMPPTFSIAELRAVYEVILGRPLDPANFRRRVRRLVDEGVVERAPGKRITGRRPAAVYRFVDGALGRARSRTDPAAAATCQDPRPSP